MSVTYIGYHGTLPAHVDSIRREGVRPSSNPDDWLGHGAYFFVAGLNEPRESARDWATCLAWDKLSSQFVVDEVAIVEVVITAPSESVFDLRSLDNARDFHLLRRRWLMSKHQDVTSMPRPSGRTYDTDLLNEMKADRGIGVLIGNLHIQLSVHERHLRLDSRIPNVSVLCLTAGARPTVSSRVTNVEVVRRSTWTHERIYAWAQ